MSVQLPCSSTRVACSTCRTPNACFVAGVPAVTQVFMDCIPKLGLGGKLLHAASFKYESAMSASELMEPKLDSGMRAAAKSVSARLQDGDLSTEVESAEALLAVFDKLFSLEVWCPLCSLLWACVRWVGGTV